MLVNFRFKNVRSFYEEANFSMEATSDTMLKDLNTFELKEKLMPKDENRLLKSAIIFGANASGKSNIIKALAYMSNVIGLSVSQVPITRMNEPFLFMDVSPAEDSLFEVEIIQNNIFYRYGFIIRNGEITEEWLDKREERITNVFRRQYSRLEIVGDDKGAAKVINLTPNALFLSVGNNFNLSIAPNLRDVTMWFRNLLFVFENQANSLDIYTLNNGKFRDQALKILNLADIGIKDISVKKDRVANVLNLSEMLQFNVQQQIQPKMGQLKQEDNNIFNIDMQTTFDVFNKDNKKVAKRDVMLFKHSGFNSEGTERLLCYLGWLLAALYEGRVILIDEIDSKLHFLVADYLLSLFNSIDKNPKNAQLICTAHNVMLMDEDLRRDQIYFASKDKYGKSSLMSLSDFKNVRKTDLFSKKYLAGLYAELPDMKKDI